MNCPHYALALVALLGLIPTLCYLLPRHPGHFLPILSVALAIVVYLLPTPVDAALSLVVPATLALKYLRIDPVPGEPVNYSPAVQKARAGVQAARDRIKKAAPTKVTEFAKKTYPSPDDIDTGKLESPDTAGEPEDATSPTEPTETEKAPGAAFDWRAAVRAKTERTQQRIAERKQRADPLGFGASYMRSR